MVEKSKPFPNQVSTVTIFLFVPEDSPYPEPISDETTSDQAEDTSDTHIAPAANDYDTPSPSHKIPSHGTSKLLENMQISIIAIIF